MLHDHVRLSPSLFMEHSRSNGRAWVPQGGRDLLRARGIAQSRLSLMEALLEK